MEGKAVRRFAVIALVSLALVLGGCEKLGDFFSAISGGSAADRPEGWESLEGSGTARRLYYQFVDARGQVRFVERLDEVPEAMRQSVGFVKLDVPPPLSPGQARSARNTQIARRGGSHSTTARSGAKSAPLVVVYSADWCGACRKAKAYLDRKGVRYQERNVDNPSIQEELVRKTGRRSIPVIDVEGRILTGFSPQAIDALIERA